jgi:hypothetical protein
MFIISESLYTENVKKYYPIVPKSLDETIEQISNLVILTNKNEEFTYVDSVNIILITSKTNLNCLCDFNLYTNIFGDGTFTFRPSHFYQMYGIHIYVN